MTGELAEHQRLVPVGPQFLHQIGKASSLAPGTATSGATSAGLQQARRSRINSARIWIAPAAGPSSAASASSACCRSAS